MKPRRPSKRPAPAARPRHQDRSEEKYHGVHACEALFARRPHDVIRVYMTKDRERRFAPLIEHCIATRKGFQVVEPDNLERLTGSVHHEGVAILARQIRRWNLADLHYLFIENVGNLVCPTSWDLGESVRLALLSVTEG
jgi:tRNA G18 (ribose-2'-O)-methylase SpoU